MAEIRQERTETRSRQPEAARAENPPDLRDSGTPQEATIQSSVPSSPDQRATTPVRTKRSSARSAAIVLGAAAAGATIGGVTGGGKGATIGAIAGGAGGYVYDRMARRNNLSGLSTDRNSAGDYAQVRRFGTPNFN